MPATVLPTPPALPAVTRTAASTPRKPSRQRDRSNGDGVKHAALGIQIGGGHEGENGKRSDDVHEGDERAGAEDGSRQRAARIVHLFAHGRDQFEPGECKRDLRPEIDRVPVPRGQHVGDSEMGRRAVPTGNDRSNAHQHQQRHIGSHAARILQPFADVQPDDVQHHSNQQACQARRSAERFGPARARRRVRP